MHFAREPAGVVAKIPQLPIKIAGVVFRCMPRQCPRETKTRPKRCILGRVSSRVDPNGSLAAGPPSYSEWVTEKPARTSLIHFPQRLSPVSPPLLNKIDAMSTPASSRPKSTTNSGKATPVLSWRNRIATLRIVPSIPLSLTRPADVPRTDGSIALHLSPTGTPGARNNRPVA